MKQILIFILTLPLFAQEGSFGPQWPMWLNPVSGLVTSATMNATGHKYAWCGRFDTQGLNGVALRKGLIRLGAVTKSNGPAALKLSIQGLSTSSGPPGQPDGVIASQVTIANANITATAWNLTGAFDVDKTVNAGDPGCAVLEFSTFGTGDSVIIVAGDMYGSSNNYLQANQAFYNGTTWSNGNTVPVIAFETSTGGYVTFVGAFPFTKPTITFNSGSNPSENALKVTCTQPKYYDAALVGISVSSSSADVDMVWYSGTTAVQTTTVDANTIAAAASARAITVTFPRVLCLPGNTYYFSIKPTTANNITLFTYDANSNAVFGAMGNTGQILSTRNGGAWSDATTSRPGIQLRVNSVPSVSPPPVVTQ